MHLTGSVPVTLFFVLSGFLITTLLLQEKKRTNNIHVKAFYIRRMLRIWPLYYFILALAFLFIPALFPEMANGISYQTVLLNVFFLNNFALGFHSMAPFAAHLWTIGVEEQFYLSWPWLVKKIPGRKLLLAILATFFFYSSIKLVLQLYAQHNEWLSMFSFGWNYSKFNCIITGAFIAALFAKANEVGIKLQQILCFLYLKTTQVLTALVLLFLLTINALGYLQLPQQVYATLFAIVVLNAATNTQTIFVLKSKWLTYLGKISFGIYMYHYMIAEIFVRKAAPLLIAKPLWLQTLIIYIPVYVLTIFVAHISYRYFESYFLKLKKNHHLTKTTTV